LGRLVALACWFMSLKPVQLLRLSTWQYSSPRSGQPDEKEWNIEELKTKMKRTTDSTELEKKNGGNELITKKYQKIKLQK
jgi:hypothetical protein